MKNPDMLDIILYLKDRNSFKEDFPNECLLVEDFLSKEENFKRYFKEEPELEFIDPEYDIFDIQEEEVSTTQTVIVGEESNLWDKVKQKFKVPKIRIFIMESIYSIAGIFSFYIFPRFLSLGSLKANEESKSELFSQGILNSVYAVCSLVIIGSLIWIIRGVSSVRQIDIFFRISILHILFSGIFYSIFKDSKISSGLFIFFISLNIITSLILWKKVRKADIGENK